MLTHQIRAAAAVGAALVLLSTSGATAMAAPRVHHCGEWIEDVERPSEQYRDRPRQP